MLVNPRLVSISVLLVESDKRSFLDFILDCEAVEFERLLPEAFDVDPRALD